MWEVPLLNTVLLLSLCVCLKCNELQDKILYSILSFNSPRVLSTQRIGPHNQNV